MRYLAQQKITMINKSLCFDDAIIQSRLKTIGGPRQNFNWGPLQANLISLPYIFFYVFPCESNFHV
jgi:hypothetical protein